MAQHNDQTPSVKLIAIVGTVVGGCYGAMVAFLLATSVMLGAPEIHPANALPPPPDFVAWMALGAFAGAGGGLVSSVAGYLSWLLSSQVRTSRELK